MSRRNIAPYNRLQRLLSSPYNYTTNTAKQLTGLYRRFSCNCARSTAYNTRPAKANITPPAPRWSVSQRRSASSAYQIPPTRRTLYRPAQPHYYNKVYKSAAYRRQCQPGGVSMFPTSGGLQSGTGSAWHPPPGGSIQQQGRGGRRGTTGGYRRSSFRAFAR